MDIPIFDKDASRQAQLAAVFESVLTSRVDDVKLYETAEEGRDPSGGSIKIKSLLATAIKDRTDLGDAQLVDYVLDKARTLHAVFIDRLRTELQEPMFAPHIVAAKAGDPSALLAIQRLMETAVYEQVDGQSEMQTLVAGVMGEVSQLAPNVTVFKDGVVEGSPELATRMDEAIAATGKTVQELQVVPKVDGQPLYVPISRVAAGLEGGRNGCRFDAITEALS